MRELAGGGDGGPQSTPSGCAPSKVFETMGHACGGRGWSYRSRVAAQLAALEECKKNRQEVLDFLAGLYHECGTCWAGYKFPVRLFCIPRGEELEEGRGDQCIVINEGKEHGFWGEYFWAEAAGVIVGKIRVTCTCPQVPPMPY